MEQHSPSVSEVLARTGAHLERAGSAGSGLSLAEWSNCDNRARYDRPDHHTLSIYLSGGDKVVREDLQISGGAPDKLCLLPAGHESQWLIGGPLRMFHLYIDTDVLCYQAMTAFDIDPQQVDLMDLTFSDDPAMAMIVRGGVLPLDWGEKSDRIALGSACHLLIHRILKRHNRRAEREIVRGGLSPSVCRRTVDYVEAYLNQPLSLDDLAAQAGLSTFHFAKMFRISFGMPPHRYMAERRIERAKHLLREGSMSIVHVALACGYSSQSYFTKAFKAMVGITPGEWRNIR